MPEVYFRLGMEHDICAIVALVESAYRGDSSRVGWTTEADILDGQRTDFEEIDELIKLPDSQILLAISEDSIIATLHIEQQNRDAMLGLFAVDPKCQNQGMGRLLLQRAELLVFEQWQCDKIIMRVLAIRDELIAWYCRQGYQRTQIYSDFPYGDIRFGLPLVDNLKFEELHKILKT